MSELTTADAAGASDRGTGYVLVVDSDADSLVFMSRLLQRLKYHICSAKTAEEAIEMATVAMPSLVVTDMSLSGMNGFELIQQLKQDPRTTGIPVIIKTGPLTPKLEQMCRQAGAEACVEKPVQADELYRKVQAAIEPKPRSHIRIRTRLPVYVNNKPLDAEAGECVSMLSAHGMFIRTLRPMPVRTILPVQITLPGQTVSADAKVVYSNMFGQGAHGEPGMGLFFVDISEKDQDHIRQYISSEVTKGIAPGRS